MNFSFFLNDFKSECNDFGVFVICKLSVFYVYAVFEIINKC